MRKNINITNEECNSYKFDIDNSYCDANDLNISFNIYIKTTEPKKAKKHFLKVWWKLDQLRKTWEKSATLYFSRYSVLYATGEKNVKCHDKCRSKQLMQILNNLGICVSYEEMLRMDYNLVDRLIHSCGE